MCVCLTANTEKRYASHAYKQRNRKEDKVEKSFNNLFADFVFISPESVFTRYASERKILTWIWVDGG